MNKTKWVMRVVVVAAAAVAIAVVAVEARKRMLAAEIAATDIEAQLDELDPPTRTAVIAKLVADRVPRR